MKKPEEVMEILEAYDLTGSLRQAAALVGCDHKTVAYWVRQRELAGGMPVVERKRPAMETVFAEKVDELVDRSGGRIRADVAHRKLVALGYEGSERTTRRWVAESKRRWRAAAWAADAAVDPGAGVVDAVGLCRRAEDRWPEDGVVLCVVGVVAVPGGGGVARQDDAVGGDRPRSRAAGRLAARRRMRSSNMCPGTYSKFCAQPSYVAAQVTRLVITVIGGVLFSRSGT